MERLRRSSRHNTYSLNWDESTPPPQDAATLKPFWKRRSRTCRQEEGRKGETGALNGVFRVPAQASSVDDQFQS